MWEMKTNKIELNWIERGVREAIWERVEQPALNKNGRGFPFSAMAYIGWDNQRSSLMSDEVEVWLYYSVSHITRNLFLTDSSAVAEKHTSSIFKECIVRGLNFICGDF